MSYTFQVQAGRPAGDPQRIMRRRDALENLLMGGSGGGPVYHPVEGIGRLGAALIRGLQYRRLNRQIDEGRSGAQESFRSVLGDMLAGGGGGGRREIPEENMPPGASVDVGGGNYADAAGMQIPEDWAPIRSGILPGESGGDYDALFGFSNRPGGKFADTKLTNMTVDQALAFANPRGPYGQWVKGQVGRVATPMGAYQVVGSTLESAKQGLGLTGNELMSPELQERIGKWIYNTQGIDAWEGYRGPRQGLPNQVSISAQPVQTASLDPTAGIPQQQPPAPAVMTSPAQQAAVAPQEPVQMAQAAPIQGQGGANPQAIFEALNNPWMPASQRQILGQLLMRQMPPTAQDQLQMDLQRQELENMRNMSPAERARLGLDERRFEFEQEQAEREANAPMMLGGTSRLVSPSGEILIPINPEAAQPLISNTTESSFAKEMGKNYAKKNQDIIDAGMNARMRIGTLQQMQQALQGAETGFGAETMLNLRRAGEAMGMDVGDLSDEEFIRATGNRIALELRNPSGGAGMPGAMSDKDREFLVSSVPGLSKTPAGNAKLIDYMMALEQRNMEVSELARQYRAANNGRIDDGFFQQLAQWSEANPMFEQSESALPQGVTEEDIEFTMQRHNMTREQVLQEFQRLNQ